MAGITTYKCLLVGDGGVGKSTYIERLRKGAFDPKYTPTLGVEVHPLVFKRGDSRVRFIVWDCAGQERFGCLRDGYYNKADCAIIMYDASKASRELAKVQALYGDIKRVVGRNVPIVLIGNKAGIEPRRSGPKRIRGDGYVDHVEFSLKNATSKALRWAFSALNKSLK